MLQTLMVPVAGLMILIAALKGLMPKARWRERAYSAFAGGWTTFGAAIYHRCGLAGSHRSAGSTTPTSS